MQNENHEKISYTAVDVAYARTFSDIPFCKQIGEICGTDTLSEDTKEMYRQLSPYFEGRSKAITNLLKDSGIKNVLEVAAGVSPRGLILTNNPEITYIETDLPDMLRQKQTILKELCEKEHMVIPNNLHFAELNVLNEAVFRDVVAQFPEGPVAIIHEGLMVYFSREEKEQFARIIHSILKERGGVWITTDILTYADLERNMPTKKLQDSIHDATKDTGRDYKTSAFSDVKDAENFFTNLGFNYTVASLKEAAGEITTTNIGIDPAYVEGLLEGKVWTLHLPSA